LFVSYTNIIYLYIVILLFLSYLENFENKTESDKSEIQLHKISQADGMCIFEFYVNSSNTKNNSLNNLKRKN